MFCQKCAGNNLDDAQFCSACGQSLTLAVSKPTLVYAGFWQRFAALFIDGFIVGAAMLLLLGVLGVVMAVSGGANVGAMMGLVALFYLVGFVISAAYFTLMEAGERGATYGKRALNIRVTDAEGNRISTGRALGRWFGHWITNCTFYIGYLIQPFTEKKQALHDMISSTVVVETDSKNRGAGVAIAIVLGLVLFVGVIGILAAVAIPAYQSYTSKAKMVEVYSAANQATHAVASFYVTHQQTPVSLIEAGYSGALPAAVEQVLYDPNTGEVQVLTSASFPSEIALKHLIYTPSVIADGSVEWACHSDDIAEIYLNVACK
ncbi:MAG: hypothetical protein RL358_1879 [Pseudomonadota bacterium]|jgi:uncharacterized RDD family membrane protein YckC/type II secretory pathway pseudopilin PulG